MSRTLVLGVKAVHTEVNVRRVISNLGFGYAVEDLKTERLRLDNAESASFTSTRVLVVSTTRPLTAKLTGGGAPAVEFTWQLEHFFVMEGAQALQLTNAGEDAAEVTIISC